MVAHYLKVAGRNLRRHLVFELINLSGLSVGFASFLLIAAYVVHESTYDAFHPHAERIYRVNEVDRQPRGKTVSAATPRPLARALADELPQAEHVARLTTGHPYQMTVGPRTFSQEIDFANPAFLEVFAFPFAEGDGARALDAVDAVVVSDAFARVQFGPGSALGQTVTVAGGHSFVVTGVVHLPSNSSLRFDVLAGEQALARLEPDAGEQWWNSDGYTFVRVAGPAAAVALEQQLPALAERHLPDWLRGRLSYRLQPLRRIHLEPAVRDRIPAVAPAYLHALGAIAAGILLIACINAVNLSTARQAQRARETGVRQALGATRWHLCGQFLGESMIVTAIAAAVGLGLAEVALPLFDAVVGLPLRFDDLPYVVPGLLATAVVVGLLAGTYPALVLSARRPVESLAGRRRTQRRPGFALRHVLVAGQFAASALLIACTLTIARQIQFMRGADLGFAPQDVLALPLPPDEGPDGPRRADAYVEALAARADAAGVVSFARTEHVPGFPYPNAFGLALPGQAEPAVVSVTSIDPSFLETYRIALRAGRPFAPGFGTDAEGAVLVNEAFVRMRGWKQPLGETVTFVHGEGPYRVIGVVADFHFESLHHPIRPQVYRYAWPMWQQYLSVRLRPGAAQRALALLEAEWHRRYPDVPFTYTFVEDRFDVPYASEVRTARLVGAGSLLAILIAGLGVLGLVSLAIAQRTKEIGIRKVLGAPVSGLVALLAREYVYLMLAALAVALPAAYGIMQRWLEGFAYRTAPGPGLFVLAAALAFAAVAVPVCVQAIRAARSNPVDALRYE